jgi:hypothetical protein
MGWQSGMNRLRKNGGKDGFVTGHDFSRADKLFILMTWALAPASLPQLTTPFSAASFSPLRFFATITFTSFFPTP